MLDVKQSEIMVINATAALAEACRAFAAAPFVAVDTEFMRETTFWPKLCLIQAAIPGRAVIIDPLASGLDLAPFYALMADKGVIKVFHAARQDIEIIYNAARIIPEPLFDTQVAAMVCGFGEAVSYSALVKQLTGRNHDKTSRFTDWSQRPLSERQLQYAIGDVTHLRDVYVKLQAKLEEAGRAHWVDDEMALLQNPDTYDMQPQDAWKRLKIRVRTPAAMAIAMEVAAWRERQAQALNVPRSRVLKDDAILDLASQAPKTPEELSRLRSFKDGAARSQRGRDLVEAVQRGLARDAASIPALSQNIALPPAAAAAADLLRVLLKSVSAKCEVASKLIATTDDLERIALNDHADVPALSGWRRELFGEAALALKAGRLALTMKDGEISVAPLP